MVIKDQEGDEEDMEEVEQAYEAEHIRLAATIASIGLSPYWHSCHAMSIYVDFLYSTFCLGFKRMPFFVEYIWVVNMVSFLDLIFQLILMSSKDAKRLYNYQPATKLYMFQNIIFIVPYYYIYILDQKEYYYFFKIFEYFLIFVNILRVHMLYSHYYSGVNRTLGQLSTVLVMIRLTLLLLFIIHSFSIFWYLLAMDNWVKNPDTGWIPSFKSSNPRFFNKYLKSRSNLMWYLIAFYYVSNATLTVGFGDIRNEIRYERWFSNVTISLGYCILTGMFTAYFNQCLKVSLQHNAIHHFRTSLIHFSLKDSASSVKINNTIERYYREIWKERKAIGEPDMLDDIPPSFRVQINEDIFMKAIRNCYILKDLPKDVSRELAMCMEIKCYLGGDLIVQRGVVATSMIYIAQGAIDLLSDEDDDSSLMVLGEGSSICITNLLIVRPARVSFRAAGFTVTHELSLFNFLRFLNKYRHFYPRIMHSIEGTLNEAYGKYVHLSMVDAQEDERPKRNEVYFLKNRFFSLHENRITDRTKRWFVQDSPMYNLYILKEWKRKAIEAELLKYTPSITVYIPIKEKEELLYDDVCLITSFPWLINPSSSFLTIWNTFLFVAATCSLIMVPLITAFMEKTTPPVLILCVMLDTIFILDFVITIFTPDDITTSKVSSLSFTLKLRQVFTYIDFLGIVPIYLIFNVFNSEQMIYRANTFIYSRKVIAYFKNLEDNHTIGLTLISILKYLYFSSVGAIIIGSFFYMMACYPVNICSADGWYYQLRESSKNSGDSQFRSPAAVCIYFSAMLLYQMGVGFVVPKSLNGYIFIIICMFVTAIIGRYLMATYSAALSLNDGQRELMEDYSKAVIQFLHNFNSPSSLLERMSTYLQVQWEKNNQAFALLENKDIMWDLPRHLKDKFLWECYREELIKQTLFRVLAEATNAEFISHLCNHVEKIKLASNDVISYSGQRLDEFHILLKGYCKLIDQNNKLIKVIGSSSMINFIESLSGVPNLFNTVTYTSCHLVKIRWKFLFALLSFHMRGDIVQLLRFKAKEILDTKLGYAALKEASEEHIKVITETDKIENFVQFSGGELESKIEYLEPFAAAGYLQIVRHLMMKVTFTPYGKFVFYWEIGRTICAFLSAIYIPALNLFVKYDSRLYIPALLLDVTAVADFYIQMHVCYYNEDNILISHPLKTAKNYFTNSFLTDFIAFLPLNYIYPSETIRGLRNVFMISATVPDILPFNRVLQMWRYDAFFSEVCNTILRPMPFLRILHYLGLTVVFLTTLNTLAVLVTLNFYYNMYDPPGTMYLHGNMYDPNWYSQGAENMPVHSIAKMFEIFITSMTCVSGLAYSISSWTLMPRKPNTFYFMFLVVIVGFIFNNWVIVKLISTRAKLDANLLAFHNNLVRFSQYLKKADLSDDLKRACREYYEFLWLETEGVFQDEVFTSVHDTLKTDCLMSAYAPALLKVDLFSSLPPHCLRAIARIVRVGYVCKNVNVLSMNIVYKDIYIVKSGRVDVFDVSGKFMKSLFPGSMFGNFESSHYVKATCTFRTYENTAFLIIDPIELFRLGKKYEELQRLFNVLIFKNSLYVATEEVIVITSHEDEVPVWILRFVDHTNYRTAQLYTYLALIINLLAAFLSISQFAYEVRHVHIYICTLSFDIFQIFQIFLSCNTPYYDYKTRQFVKRKRLIRKRYMHTSIFYLRIFSVLPLYLIPNFPGFPTGYRRVAARCFMINKTLYVYFTFSVLNMLMTRVDLNMLFYKSLQSIFTLSMGVHMFTCLWRIVRCNEQNVCQTVSITGESYTICDDRGYMCNLYIVLQSLTTAGLGDILPVNEKQMLVLSLFSIGGVFMMAAFIGDIVDILDLMRLTYTNFSHQVSLLVTYLRINKISEGRISDQFKYCKRIWDLEEGKQIPLFAKRMPAYLKRESNIQLYGRAFMNNFIFGAVPMEFLKQMLQYIEREVYISNNVIVSKGQACETLYLILQGEVVCRNGKTTVSTLYHGAFFGMRSGLFVNVRSMFSYIALKTTYIIKLNLSSWSYLLDFFPSARSEIYYRASASGITPHPDYTDFITSNIEEPTT